MKKMDKGLTQMPQNLSAQVQKFVILMKTGLIGRP